MEVETPPVVAPKQPPEVIETQEQPGNDIAALTERFNKLEEENGRLKGSVSAKDKTLLALQKKQDDLAKAAMSKEELIDAQRKEEHEKNVVTFLGLKKQELKLDDGFEALLGKDYDSIEANAVLLNAFAEKITADKDAKISELETELAKYKAQTGDPGQGNTGVSTDLQAQYDAAVKANDGDLMFSIKEQMIAEANK